MNRHTGAGPYSNGAAVRDTVLLGKPDIGMNNRIEVEFEAGPSAAASARNALLALDGRVEEDLLNDVRLLVSELVTNSVRHANVRPHDRVRMRVQVSARTLRVEVSDPGEGFEPKRRDPDRTRPGGWGLYLVDHLADRWGVARNDLTQVWFEMDQGHPRGAAA